MVACLQQCWKGACVALRSAHGARVPATHFESYTFSPFLTFLTFTFSLMHCALRPHLAPSRFLFNVYLDWFRGGVIGGVCAGQLLDNVGFC